MRNHPAIIVFSHLRWDFVFQRPQHLLSRLAADHRIFFIEEPIHHDEDSESLHRTEPLANLAVCRPRLRVTAPGFADAHLPALRRLLAQLVAEEDLRDYVTWFYTPMALPLLADLAPRAVIYDCMDELSAFLHAPPQMREREAELLGRADVVFTGGRSLYLAKKDRHPNVHCFPSSVDAAHFGRAASGATETGDRAALPHPRLGFFGVIDERMDLALVDALARARPDYQIVMVGPVVKIDPARLPDHPNLHWLGQRGYDQLPGYLAGWDVCLLPFARNESTRYISPTKTLEYMAAGKPIVSTPITDVAVPYGDMIYLADTAEQFVAACDRALIEEPDERTRRLGRMREVLAATSWDRTVAAMAQEITRILGQKSEQQVVQKADQKSETPAASVRRTRRVTSDGAALAADDAAASRPFVVIGAGPTGLSAAYHLGEDALLLEQNQTVGGWCRSLQDNGFTFDFAGHIMFSNDPYVHELYARLLGDNVHWQDREAWIYSKNTYTRYPFQGALYGLPADVIKECVVGAIEARFGSVRKQAGNGAGNGNGHGNGSNGNGHGNGSNGNGHGASAAAGNDAHCKAESITDCCADGVTESTAPLGVAAPVAEASAGPRNFEEFIYQVWGAGIARHFAIPYNRKLWAVPLTEMETSWLGGRVPLPDLEEMIEGALHPVPKPMGPNARFGYPLRGGFQALMNGFLPYIQDSLRTGSRITAVSPGRRTVTVNGSEEIPYRYLISTMPLPVLIRLMGDEAPARVQEAASKLRYVSVRCVNLGVGRENLTEKHWIYYPEQTVFHRIFVQGNASPHCNPPGGFGLTCEITYSEHKPLPCDGDELIQRCIRDCHEVGLFRPGDPIWAANQVDLPYAYVVYDHARPANVALIREWLATRQIILAGRYSEWEYYNSDHAFLAGKKAAETAHRLLREEQTAAQAAAVPGDATARPGSAEARPGRAILA
jgi:UDP-galactopyranose mutase